MTFSTKRAAVFASVVLMLTACDPSGPKQATTPSPTSSVASPVASPKTDVTASPGTTMHDGRTVRAVNPGDCASPTVDDIKRHLGTVADQIQPPVAASAGSDGTIETSCTFSLAPSPAGQAPDPGNALTVSTTVYPNPESLATTALPRLMMSPQPLEGVGSRAWFSRNGLSSTTEYVLEAVQGQSVTRVNLALPATAAPLDEPEAKLAALLTGQ